MLFRFDLTEEEALHSRWLSELCINVARPDFVEVLRHWDEFRLALLSRRVIVLRPAEALKDFLCLYYGDELQERFHLDFTGKTFAEIPGFTDIQASLEPYALVSRFKVPHIARVVPSLREHRGVDYTRIIHPVMEGDRVRLVVAIVSFHRTD